MYKYLFIYLLEITGFYKQYLEVCHARDTLLPKTKLPLCACIPETLSKIY